MKHAKHALAAAVLAAAVVTLSACGGSDGTMSSGTSMTPMKGMGQSSSGPAMPASGPHNAADVTFSTQMISHHAQAVEMTDLVLASTQNAKVRALATQIRNAQTPEITTMSGWLKGWGEPVPDTTMAGQDMGGMSMDGMMSDSEMNQLKQAQGTQADTEFLTLMSKHHAGAIEMSKTELTSGQNAAAKELATSIIETQTAEIADMQGLLNSIG
ncbi:DUF305 domain-containing protein [Spongisporangium articulatum]|uniref:DUF305 domain-containing protein n=1 Tax=Spongisporangium articulatum TaxID=3362603 RepID=A0ABW8AU64_9ACTN